MSLKKSECPVCKKVTDRPVILYERYWVCNNCRSLMEIKKVKITYPKSYYERKIDLGWMQNLFEKVSFLDRLRTLDISKKDKILEIGFGNGEFLRELNKRGYQVFGLEDSGYAVKEASNYLKKENIYNNEKFIKSKEKFDVILMYHVLEHIENPDNFVKFLTKKLKPGGRIVLRVPNVNSWEAKLGKEKWYHLDYPYHKVIFTDRGIKLMLEKLGFKQVKIRHDLLDYRQVMMYSLLNCLNIKITKNIKFLTMPIQAIIMPIYWLFSLIAGNSGVIEVQGILLPNNNK